MAKAKKSTVTPTKTAVVESAITTRGGVDPDAPPKADWEKAANPSPEEQRAQSEALARELAAKNK
jgi:hypothetical protein